MDNCSSDWVSSYFELGETFLLLCHGWSSLLCSRSSCFRGISPLLQLKAATLYSQILFNICSSFLTSMHSLILTWESWRSAAFLHLPSDSVHAGE